MNSAAIDITLQAIRPDRQLHYENYQVVSAVQALLGAITSTMVAISLCCLGSVVHLHFYLEAESETDAEEVQNVVEDLECLQLAAVAVRAHIHVVGKRPRNIDHEGRLIYRRHEPPTEA